MIGDRTGGPWEGYWPDGLGFLNPTRLGLGSVSMGAPFSGCLQAITGLDGAHVTFWEDSNNNAHRQFWLLRDKDIGLESYNLTALSLDPPYEAYLARGLYESKYGTGVFLTLGGGAIETRDEHWLVKDGQWITETPMQPYLASAVPMFGAVTADDKGGATAIFLDNTTKGKKDFECTCFLAERVDPRP